MPQQAAKPPPNAVVNAIRDGRRHQDCKRLPSTSVTSTLWHFVSALNAFGLFACAARLVAENVPIWQELVCALELEHNET